MNTELDQYRLLPSIDELLQAPPGQQLVSQIHSPIGLARAARRS